MYSRANYSLSIDLQFCFTGFKIQWDHGAPCTRKITGEMKTLKKIDRVNTMLCMLTPSPLQKLHSNQRHDNPKDAGDQPIRLNTKGCHLNLFVKTIRWFFVGDDYVKGHACVCIYVCVCACVRVQNMICQLPTLLRFGQA